MATKRRELEEFVTKLRQNEVLVGRGISLIDAIREVATPNNSFRRSSKTFFAGTVGSKIWKFMKDYKADPSRRKDI